MTLRQLWRVECNFLWRVFVIVLLFMTGVSIDGLCATPGWKPNQSVELIVGVSAGSAHDRTARLIQKILQDQRIVETPIVVTNKPGGGQTISLTYLASHAKDPNFLLIASVPLLTKKLMGQSALTYTDFTPITQLFNEYIAFAVKSDSPLRTGKDLVNRLKKNPNALSIAVGSSLGNGPHLALSLAMKEGGVNIRELRAVTFKGGAEATVAVLGGHVDVLATTTGNILNLLKSGKMKVLAVSSAKRLGAAYASVPTWKEQGIDAEFSSFRVLLAPGGIDSAQVAYWEEVFAQLSKTHQWKRDLQENYWAEGSQGHAESESYLRKEYARLEAILTELGLTRR